MAPAPASRPCAGALRLPLLLLLLLSVGGATRHGEPTLGDESMSGNLEEREEGLVALLEELEELEERKVLEERDELERALLPCGTHKDFSPDSKEMMAAFTMATDVCCGQLGEECQGAQPLPLSCHSPACARAVKVVEQSCRALLNADYFQVFAQVYKPLITAAAATCVKAHPPPFRSTPLPRRYPITAVSSAGALAAPSAFNFGGVLTDGLGEGGAPNPAGPRPWDAVIHGGQGSQLIELTLQALWLAEGDTITITNETDPRTAVPLVTLSGHDLPPVSQHARAFTAGRFRVKATLKTDSSFFSLGIQTKCVTAGGCTAGGIAKGNCVAGKCACYKGYSGDACQCGPGTKPLGTKTGVACCPNGVCPK